ncbi:reverse transcriptase domain, Reverse transcriptase zinc-binding domain protein [Artemisia annua]|uniref:Reverse transcriptase domain, Reverse transcriptase zinc-binding domain protein n=1 Tax=Artemisia annua TaxID=35608 RepID=A0A2U1KKX9_ARTAN|nr:reverse transcriptase domain, Reverse transcriptase zinc-binding domain protein [Artemisia annua]
MKEGVKKISWVSWNKVLVSKTDGGLGVGSIKTKNMGLLGKWKWRFINEQGALWRKVIAEIHGSSGGFDTMGGSNNNSTWSSIVGSCNRIEHLGVPLNNLMVRKIYRGTQTLFWKDNWLNNLGPLKECFPRLFALERFKDCLVADRWVLEEGVWQGKWDWNRQPSGRADGDLTKLVTDLNGFTLDEAQDDRWEWTLTSSRKFTVASLCHAIHWWKVPSRFSLTDILKGNFDFTNDKWRMKLCHAACLSFIWYVWKWRNKILHASSNEEVSSAQNEDIFPVIQRLSLLWTSNRVSNCRFTWCHWIRAPGEVANL